MAAKSTAQKFQDYDKLKTDAHAKVETLTSAQLRKFLAAYRNPGGWEHAAADRGKGAVINVPRNFKANKGIGREAAKQRPVAE